MGGHFPPNMPCVKGNDLPKGGRREGAGRKPIPDRMRPFPFGSPSPAPAASGKRCSSQALHCRRTSNPRENRIFSAYCDSWRCPRCREILKRRWKEHLTVMSQFVDRNGDYLCLAFVFRTSRAEWRKSVRRYLERHGADFACLQLLGGDVAVINNRGEGTILYSGEFPPAIKGEVYPFEAGLDEIFAAIDCQRRPISTSKNWRRKDDGQESEWELVHRLNGPAFKAAKPKLEKWGVHVDSSTVGDKTTLHFKWPASFTPGDIACRESMLAPITLKRNTQ